MNGDRWILWDSANKQKLARFDYKLPNTDQKQLPEVEIKKLTLGSFTVEKYTVTSSFPPPGEKATDGLITSYAYHGPLEGLVVMSEEYDASSALDGRLEKSLKTIQLK